LRGNEKTLYQKEQGYDTDRGDCIRPIRPVSQDKWNKIEKPDRFSQGSNRICQVDTNDDNGGDYHYTRIRCKGFEGVIGDWL